jgi:hypothetical protein
LGLKFNNRLANLLQLKIEKWRSCNQETQVKLSVYSGSEVKVFWLVI